MEYTFTRYSARRLTCSMERSVFFNQSSSHSRSQSQSRSRSRNRLEAVQQMAASTTIHNCLHVSVAHSSADAASPELLILQKLLGSIYTSFKVIKSTPIQACNQKVVGTRIHTIDKAQTRAFARSNECSSAELQTDSHFLFTQGRSNWFQLPTIQLTFAAFPASRSCYRTLNLCHRVASDSPARTIDVFETSATFTLQYIMQY